MSMSPRLSKGSAASAEPPGTFSHMYERVGVYVRAKVAVT